MREPARGVGRPVPTFLRAGKDDMAPVFGEGGNLPTRFFEFTSVWRTTRDGHDVASMA